MSDRRRGLGRGLEALLPGPPRAEGEATDAPGRSGTGSPVDVLFPDRHSAADAGGGGADAAGTSDERASGTAAARFAELPLDAVTPNPRQPRQVFDEESMAELVASIREVGLLQPVVVRAVAAGRYELVMGERRWRAARLAGLERLPAIVRATDDEHLLRDALLENLHRSQLNPLEEAAAYDQMLRDFGCTHEELAARLGRSRPQVSNTLRLLRLPPPVQRRVAAGVLSAGHARALVGLDEPAAQERLAQRIVAEGLSVRAAEELVATGQDAPERPPRRRVPKPVSPRLQDIAAALSDRFETRVKVDLGRSKGRIVVEFASLDDLERILATMTARAPTAAGEGGPDLATPGPSATEPAGADVPLAPVEVQGAPGPAHR